MKRKREITEEIAALEEGECSNSSCEEKEDDNDNVEEDLSGIIFVDITLVTISP